jgi:cytochrome P450
MAQDYIINVNDLDLPIIESTFPRREQKDYALNIASQNWLAKNAVGFTALKHEDVSNIFKNNLWHSAYSIFIDLNPLLPDAFKERRRNGLLSLNGQDHSRLKRIIAPLFSTANAEMSRLFMRQTMEELIEQKFQNKNVDIQKEIFNYYPIIVLCKVIGIPNGDLDLFLKWSKLMFSMFSVQLKVSSEEVVDTQKEFDTYFNCLIEEKRKNPSNDLISMLIELEQNGEKITVKEICMLIEVIIASGIDTSRCQLGLISRMLLENKQILNRLSIDPKENSSIFEELTRIDSVSRGAIRVASEDIIYKNIFFPKGTIMFLNTVTANHDERVWDNPNEIIFNGRENISKSLSYGLGAHHCLGMGLAKVQLQEGLTVLFSYLKEKIIQWDCTPISKTSIISGLESLTVSIK